MRASQMTRCFTLIYLERYISGVLSQQFMQATLPVVFVSLHLFCVLITILIYDEFKLYGTDYRQLLSRCRCFSIGPILDDRLKEKILKP